MGEMESKMKKLDAGIKTWLICLIVGLVSWFSVPFLGIPSTLETFVKYAAVLIVMAFGLAVYGTVLATTANQAANYHTIEEALKDINGDVRSYGILLFITTVLVSLPITFYCFIAIVKVPSNLIPTVSYDLMWAYGVIILFHIALTFLRNYERRLTVKNALNRFYEMNPTRIVSGA